jgi:hypothetical protein
MLASAAGQQKQSAAGPGRGRKQGTVRVKNRRAAAPRFLDTFRFRNNLVTSPMATNKSSKAKAEKATPAPVAKVPPKPVAKPVSAVAKPYEPTQEEIQTRAFEIYVAEGCKPGHDLENWVRAEKELRAKASR